MAAKGKTYDVTLNGGVAADKTASGQAKPRLRLKFTKTALRRKPLGGKGG